jgi:hypothetical protein
MDRYSLKKLNDVEVKDEYLVKLLDWFAALKNFDCDDNVDISKAWKNIRNNIKASARDDLCYDFKWYNLRFDGES